MQQVRVVRIMVEGHWGAQGQNRLLARACRGGRKGGAEGRLLSTRPGHFGTGKTSVSLDLVQSRKEGLPSWSVRGQ